MRYIKNGRIAEDAWVSVTGDAPVPSDVAVIVSADWLLAASNETLGARKAPLGVQWPNDRPVSELAPFVQHLALVALEFPSFRDGRAYTQAVRLRQEHGFTGELRATGDVLRDQFLFMVRSGFDAFEVKKAADAQHFSKAVHEFSVLYQPAADKSAPVLQTRLAAHRPSPAQSS